MSSCCIVVMAKAPVAGYAKTRLIPALGAQGAARIAELLLAHAVDQACGAGPDEVVLCAAPDRHHPSFERLRQEQGLRLTEQGSGDLGARMHRAFLQAFARHERVLLMGTDAPALSSDMLRAALKRLAPAALAPAASATGDAAVADAVFVPALDGGYALVGLRRACESLFVDLPWSTPQVMAITRQRAGDAGLQVAELQALADIDEPQDLVHLPARWQTHWQVREAAP